jgi:phage baseplate assembly protein V
MKQLLNQMRMQARMAASDTSLPKTGIVTSYDPDHYAVKVELQPEGIKSGWLPLLSPWVGNGWGMFCAPSVGDMVELQFEQGDAEAAFACLRFFNNQARPLAAPSGEFWLVHASGSFAKLTNDGKLLLNGQVEIDMTAPALNITVTGAANVKCDTAAITASSSVTLDTPTVKCTHDLQVAGNTTLSGTLGVSGQSTLAGVTSNGKDVGSTHKHPNGNPLTGTPI